MLFQSLLSLASLAGTALANPTGHVVHLDARENKIDKLTAGEVDLLELYSQYSAATYCNKDTPAQKPVRCEANCDRVLSDKAKIVQSFYTGNETDIAGYVAVVNSRKEIIFAARGTASDQNWNTNLDCATVNTTLVPGGAIHQGFYKAWKSIAKNVSQAIDKAQETHRGYHLIVTGHSLGGAIAAVGAAHLRAEGRKLDLYTYGQPRVGNAAFSDFITNQPGLLFRVTHNADPVPRLAPTKLWPFSLLEYRHTSPEIWLTGYPDDPLHWPLRDVLTCSGNLNYSCNANEAPLNATDHGVYFGKMSCFADPNKVGGGVLLPIDITRGLADQVGDGAVETKKNEE